MMPVRSIRLVFWATCKLFVQHQVSVIFAFQFKDLFTGSWVLAPLFRRNLEHHLIIIRRILNVLNTLHDSDRESEHARPFLHQRSCTVTLDAFSIMWAHVWTSYKALHTGYRNVSMIQEPISHKVTYCLLSACRELECGTHAFLTFNGTNASWSHQSNFTIPLRNVYQRFDRHSRVDQSVVAAMTLMAVRYLRCCQVCFRSRSSTLHWQAAYNASRS